jgi:carbon monoxide dehydrogenase subunit G
VEFTGRGTVDAPPAAVFAVVADLTTYPRWLGIVQAVASDGDGDGAWAVDLGARLGPLRRTKRLRMVNTERTPTTSVRFERQEQDDRAHSPWVLGAALSPTDEGARTDLVMRLSYGGGAWIPGLDLVLRAEVARAVPRLAALAREAN